MLSRSHVTQVNRCRCHECKMAEAVCHKPLVACSLPPCCSRMCIHQCTERAVSHAAFELRYERHCAGTGHWQQQPASSCRLVHADWGHLSCRAAELQRLRTVLGALFPRVQRAPALAGCDRVDAVQASIEVGHSLVCATQLHITGCSACKQGQTHATQHHVTGCSAC